MRKKVIILSMVAVFSLFCTLAHAVVPAFPGAEGAGKYAVGGRGGTVYEVTNLNDSGAGSLRAAIDASGPRIVVFRVSGTIELASALNIFNPYITIAGQTAPGDGITLKNRPLNINGYGEVIVRYLRVRSSEFKDTYVNRDVDCMNISYRGSNVIVDHCSFSWGIDEMVSPQGIAPWPLPPDPPVLLPTDNLTVQWCIVSNPLNKSVHTEGTHAKGTLAKGCYGSKFSFHHNIYAHIMDRNPWISGLYSYATDPNGALFDFCNNVIYNWGNNQPSFSRAGSPSWPITQVNFVGNYYKSGVNSPSNSYVYRAEDIYGRGYFADNWKNDVSPSSPWDIVLFTVNFTQQQIDDYKQSSAITVGNVPVESALVSYDSVLADAGCSAPYRDSVDRRVVEEIDTGTGEVIDCTTPGDFYYQIGTAKGGAANKIILPDTYPAREKGQIGYDIEITGGTGAGQTRLITFYQDDTGGEPNHYYLVSPDWTVMPDATSTFGVIVDCTKNAGGWPVLVSTTPPPDSDHDGMPDAWETARDLNPADVNDGKLDRDSDGYTNVEEYLNYLAAKKTVFPADFDSDGDVDNSDLDLFTEEWLKNDCDDMPRRNLDTDCDVDFSDYAVFADYWLQVY